MKNEKIVIGFFGMEIFSGNMGCVALTYSMTSLVKRIGEKLNKNFKYYYFVRNRHGDPKTFCKNVGISENNVDIISAYDLTKTDIFMRNLKFKYYVSKCDLIIDMTQGDSFSDIYGYDRFNIWTAEKEWVISEKIPLILGPQTFGPYKSNVNKLRAKKVVENAELVIARDQVSFDYLKDFCTGNILCSTDIAFLLPYIQPEKKINAKKILVGLNVSGLLWTDNLENTNKDFILSVDYQEYIRRVIDFFISKENVEIILTPHVSVDIAVCKKLLEEYPQLKMVSEFVDPIKAKSCIAGYDFFIGARMHSTIAAISSGVSVIPVSYSRKFQGLFNTLNYNFLIDLVNMSTHDAVNLTKQYFEMRNFMQKAALNSAKEAKKLINITEKAISDVILTKLIK